MAFTLSVTPTAGVGTVSVTRDSTTVTGVGTNFTSPSLVGRIILVNGFNSLVASVQSATALTLSRTPTQSLTAESFTHVANGTTVTQTSTDTALSGLSAIEGVGKSTLGNQTTYFMGALRLLLSGSGGSLTYNANTENMVWDSSTAPEVTVNSGCTLTVTGARTDGTYSASFYPRAMGWARLGSEFLPGDSPIIVNGTFNASGVWFDGSTTEQLTGTCNIVDCKWTNTVRTANYRLNSASISINGLALYGSNLTLITVPAQLDGVKFYNSTYVPVSLPATTAAAPRTYENWDFQGALPLVNNFGANANYIEFVNLGSWDGFRLASNASLSLAIRFTKRVSLAVTDASNAAVSDAVVYRLDTNNGNRGTYYTTDEHFILTTVAGAATGKILAQVGRFPAGASYNSTVYTAVMDYRNAANDGTGADTLYFASYSHLMAERAINTKGTGTLSVAQTVFADANVTLSRTAAIAKLASSFTVDAATKVITVTANSTYDDLYDAMKAHKCTANAVNLATPARGGVLIVTPSGTNLTAYAGWSLVVNTGVTLSAGVKFTYIYFGTITLNGTGQITGVYASTAGTSTIWQFQSIQVGTSLVVYDSTGTTKYFQSQVTSAGTYSYYIPPGVTGTYYYAVEKYGKAREYGNFPANSGGILFYVPDYVEDVGISQTTQATVAAYTTLETLDKFYDFTAYSRLSETFIKLGQIATRSGTAVDIGTYSLLVKSTASAVEGVAGSLLTIKAASFGAGSKYSTIIATPPATVTANTTEPITCAIEDANGDSQVTIQGGSGNFTLWKLANSVPDDDYATGVNLGDVGNVTYRFVHADGYKIIIRDNSTAYRIPVPMTKGIYTRGLFFGDQVQLAQSAEVTQINTKVDLLTNSVADINSLVDDVKLKTDELTFTQAGAVDANIQYVNDVEVSGTGSQGNEWGPV